MPRYGGEEDYDDVIGRLSASEDAIDRLVAKERLYERELESTAAAETDAQRAAERTRRARQESLEVARRTRAAEEQAARQAGRSERVFHGTGAAFQGAPRRQAGSLGTYVSTDPGEAASHGQPYSTRRLIPLEMQYKRLLDLTQEWEKGEEILRAAGAPTNDPAYTFRNPGQHAEAIRTEAMGRGYDAIRISGKNLVALEDDMLRITEQSTEAIQRNTQARERLGRVQSQQALNTARLARGAGDPMFGRAYEMAQRGQASQYAFRRDLPGVGSRRAAMIQEAIAAGYRPGTPGADRPLTRARAAEVGMATADAELEQAKRAYANSLRRKAATQEERQGYYDARDRAAASRRAATLELESARNEAAARAENAAAARREAVGRDRATANLVAEQKARSREPFGLLPAAGQTAQMPVRSLALGTRVPVAPDPRIIEGGGAGRYGGGSRIYDDAVESRMAAQNAQTLADAQRDAAAAAERVRAQRIDAYYRQMSSSSADATREVMRQGVAFGTTSQAMYRHGALTSEFIAAAARGETTLRELGNQALITAGKFGGWTAAATALYGAFGAISEVGRGAIDASDGVTQLSRVISNIPDGARGVLADLAQEFNVPIATAADAVYRMGQRYHNFGDAVEAARASLYSFKTGEVDVETSTRQLISITSGFGQTADELSDRYDQINQAQNVFGVRIAETEAGMAKAAGAFRNAGGDFDHLLALMVAINRATGVSGTEIGTAISRAVTQIKVPAHITKLRQLGVDIDPTDLQQTILSAMEVVRRAPVDQRPELSNVLASQIFGNQYARQLAPILRDQTTFNEALRDTAPEKAKGSAQRELAKVLSENREQLEKIGVGLQVLGERLAEAGAFAPLAAMLKLLNTSLTTVNDILGAFNELPQPIRQAVTLLGEGYILLQAMRRLGVTDKLLGGPFAFAANPERRLQIFGARGLRTARDQGFNEVERAGQRTYQRAQDVAIARADVVAYKPQVDAAMKMAGDSEERARILTHANGLSQAEAAASARYVRSERELLERKRLAYGLERQLAELSALHPSQVSGYMRTQGIPLPRELAAPNMLGVQYLNEANRELAEQVEREIQQTALVGGRGGSTGERLSRSLDRQVGPLTTRVTSQMQAMTGSFRDYSDRLARRIGGEAASAGYVVRGVERTAIATTTAVGAATRTIEAAAGGLRRVRGGFRNFIRGFGPLDAALLAIIGIDIVGDIVAKYQERERALDARIRNDAANVQRHRQRMVELRKAAADDSHFARPEELLRGLGEIIQPKNLIGAFTGDYEDPVTRRRRRQERAEVELAEERRRESLREEARSLGTPIPFLFSSQVIQAVNRDAELREQGLISQGEFDRRMANHAIEATKLVDNNKRRIQAARHAIAAARRAQGGQPYQETLAGLDEAGLQGEVAATTAAVQLRGLGGGNLSRLGQQYAEAERRWGGRRTSAALVNLANAREAYYNTVTSEVNRELQAALGVARNERERRAAFRRAQQRILQVTRGVQQREQVEPNDVPRHDLRTLLDQGPFGQLMPTPSPPLDPQPPTRENRLRATLPPLVRAARALGVRIGAARDDIRDGNRSASQIERELLEAAGVGPEAQYQDRQTGRQIRADLTAAQTQDQGAQAAAQLRAARGDVTDAARTFGRQSRQYRQALTSLYQARQSQAETVLANVEADNALLLAQAGTEPTAQANAAVQAAQNTLAALRASGGDPNAVKQAQADLINAQNQRTDQQREQAQQMAELQSQLAAARGDEIGAARLAQRAARLAQGQARNPVERLQALLDLTTANEQLETAIRDRQQARFDLLASRTEDPVRQARIQRDAARTGIRGTTGTERLRARAEYNRARQVYRNARLDDRVDTINFQLEMDKISSDEAARLIQGLSRMKGISRQKRRELLLQARRLREGDGSELELNVGNIRLPTLYDVRRLAGVGFTAPQSRVVTNTAHFEITVNRDADVEQVGAAIDRVFGTSLAPTLRSSGMT